MSGSDIRFETWTPETSGGNPESSPLRVRTWFDQQRNTMVVEVLSAAQAAERDAQAEARAKAAASK